MLYSLYRILSRSNSSPVRLTVPLSFRASLCHSVRPSARPCVPLSVRASLCPSVRASVLPCVPLPVHASLCPSVRPSVRPCVPLSFRASLCPSVRASLRPSVSPFVANQPRFFFSRPLTVAAGVVFTSLFLLPRLIEALIKTFPLRPKLAPSLVL